jgi:hypothetical protein
MCRMCRIRGVTLAEAGNPGWRACHVCHGCCHACRDTTTGGEHMTDAELAEVLNIPEEAVKRLDPARRVQEGQGWRGCRKCRMCRKWDVA